MNAPQRTTQYMHSAGGTKIYPFEPRPEDFTIETIAHHLANNGRWNGATQHPLFRSRIFYSVAEHSVYCSWFIEREMGRPDLALEALLHDAPEAVTGDLIRPLKHSPEIYPIYKTIEDANEEAIAKRFNLIFPLPKEVKTADEAVCAAESRQIVPKSHLEEWVSGRMHDETVVAPYEIQMLDPYHAREFFLQRFEDLMSSRARYRALPLR